MELPKDWLAARTPPAPDPLRAWFADTDVVADPDRGGRSVSESLLEAGVVHLEKAVARPGRHREAAYQLLAADALITYGCEAASEADDLRGALVAILGRVGTGGSVQ
jgi:hypothetical protein